MANRSDFYKAKLPRYLKRMLASMSIYQDAHEHGKAKRLFISAHAAHVAFKQKRNSGNEVTEENTEE